MYFAQLSAYLKVVFFMMKSVTMRLMTIFAVFHLFFFSAGTLHHLFPLFQ